MTFYGADVDQLRALAKAVDKAANLLSTKASSLQGQIMAAPWKGSDGDQFRHEWTSSHRPSLDRIVSSLQENARMLKQNADEQEKSSGADTGAGATAPSPGSFTALADWFTKQVEEAKALNEHRDALESGLAAMVKGTSEEQAAWWASLSAEDQKYLIEGSGKYGPLATELMKMDGGIPESVQQQAREHLQDVARADIPIYSEAGSASIEARVAWVHGGAEVGTEVVENADGSATMMVYGNMGLGVNDTSGTVGATLNGEVSREYTFGSVEEAMAAREQMYRDLPPDSAGDIKDVAGNPPGYILDTIDSSAAENGTTGHDDKAKGTLSFEAEGEAGAASGSASLDLAYEKNLTDGTSTASAEVSASGKLDLDGQTFEASGKGGLQLNMGSDNTIDSVSLSMEGTVAQGLKEGIDVDAAKVESSVTSGAQGTVKIDVAYTPENKEVIDSYMRNVALGNDSAADQDAARLYDAGAATVQVNSVVNASTEAGFDVKVGEVEVKTETEVSTNVSTYYKVPNDTRLESL